MVKLLAALVSLVALIEATQALPIERFTGPIDLKCSPDQVCGSSVRSPDSLGGRLGISIAGGRRSEAQLRSRGSAGQRSLEVTIPGEAVGAVTFSWDGDPYPHQLSSGGLGCLNLRADGGVAFRIESFEVRGDCEGHDDTEQGCQPITIETRIYHASDPTGQRYSASILRRKIPRRGAAFDIPFSNFIHQGPRGEGTFDCVGAVSISIKLEGQHGLRLEVGSINTVGRGSELPASQTPVATSSQLPSPTSTPQHVSTEPPSPRPSVIPTQVELALPANTPRAQTSPTRLPAPTPTTAPTRVPPPPGLEVPTATPEPTAPSRAIAEIPPPEEKIFGAVTTLPLTPTPEQVNRKGRKLWD